MQVIFDHAQDETSNIRTFYFKPERQVDYTAGQFIELTLSHPPEDSRGGRRWFTLSSSPTERLLAITTKFAAEKSSSFKRALLKLEPGKVLHMSDPMGDFVLPKLIQTPLIFVAGGIGITPFHSMLAWLTATGEQRPLKLLIGVRNESEIVFQDIFKKAGIHATIIVAQPSAAWGGEHGDLSAERIIGLEKPAENSLIYTSGPEPMVEALQHDLLKAGLRRNQLVSDFFPGYASI